MILILSIVLAFSAAMALEGDPDKRPLWLTIAAVSVVVAFLLWRTLGNEVLLFP